MGKAARVLDWSDLERMRDYALAHERYRDYLLIMAVAGTGFRHCDWRSLTFGHFLIEGNTLTLQEKKTDKPRTVYLSDEVKEAAKFVFDRLPVRHRQRSHLAFHSLSRVTPGAPLTRAGVKDVMERLGRQCGIDGPISSHSLRKAFGRHVHQMMGGTELALITLQKIFNHADVQTTRRYIGLEEREIMHAYQNIWK
jgi:integrase